MSKKLGGGKAIGESKTISVYGMLSTWKTPDSPFLVRCVSTYANPIETTGHGHLLDELKPLRDRTPVKELSHLNSVLQRSLNDARVANELIPYLSGVGSKLSFFPAVLGVLMPKSFLSSDGCKYPLPTSNDDSVVYGDEDWSYSSFELEEDDKESPFVTVKISLHKTNIVVIDGQHRVNAFRYLTDKSRISKGIYEIFYDTVKEARNLDASLPVTLIWFESDDPVLNPIEPTYISRQLFIDVNSNARSVSSSRKILLDDRNVCRLATQELYQNAAERSFDLETFSLLHTAFDMESELAKVALPKLSLTSPEVIEDCFWWCLFGSGKYDQLDKYRVDRDLRKPFVERFSNVTESDFHKYCKIVDREPHVLNRESESKVRELVRDRVVPSVAQLFENFFLFKGHYEACRLTSEWVADAGTDGIPDVWNHVFCGGEGLYWILRDPVLDSNVSEKIRIYRKAISDIEKTFSKFRASSLGVDPASRIDKCFDSITTKAFQVGFTMAAFSLAKDELEDDLIGAAEQLVSVFNEKEIEEWLFLLTEFKSALFDGTADPKKWPTYQKLFLRIYDGECTKIFSNVTDRPEFMAFRNLLKRKIEVFAEEEDEMPSDSKIRASVKKTYGEFSRLLEKSGLFKDDFESLAISAGSKYFKEEIFKYFKQA